MTKILIVDDNEQNLYLLRVLLQGHSFQVAVARDGRAALTQARQDPPDLIITDILMPVMDGFALCREWKADERLKEIPFVFYTATYTDPEDEAFALGLGADRFIRKPAEPDVFVEVVREVIEEEEVGKLSASHRPGQEETIYLRQYSEALIRKLEDKMTEVEAANRALERDIAERELAEMALAEERNLLRTLIDALPDHVYVKDQEGRLTLANNAQVSDFGLSALDEIIGKTDFELLPADLAERIWANDRLVFESEDTLSTEEEFVGHTGESRWVWSIKAPLLSASGEVTGLVGVSRDVTERKRADEALRESEERYRTLFDNAGDAITIHDLTGRFMEVNRVACERLGYSREELVSMSLSDIEPPGDAARISERLEALKAKEHFFVDAENVRRDGSVVPVEVHARLVEYRGRPAVLSIARDVSDRRKLEAQLLQAQKMEAVGRLAGGVAHDFNNILTAILGYSDFLLRDLDESDPRREDLEGIRRSADRATALTRQLLAFSRRQIMQPRVVNLNDLIGNLTKMLDRLIGEDIEMIISPAIDLGQVKVDPGQTEQVILNLVVNAREAMPQGGRITLATEMVRVDDSLACVCGEAEPGEYVKLAVTDTGAGMDVETRRHLFEPFFTTKERGTGLGLATVYGIVRQSSGHITLESEAGQGTTFNVFLPLVTEEPDVDTQRREVRDWSHGTETVLLVEDAEQVRHLASLTLSRGGYTVLETANGEEALRSCSVHDGPIHLLLTDVVMPGGMSGPQVAHQLTALRPEMKLLCMSGYTDDAIAHHGVLDEGIEFLEKPFTPSALLLKVRQVLDG